MHTTNSLAVKLRTAYPQFQFLEDKEFRWSPQEKTVFYREDGNFHELLHELAHAVLGHTTYGKDMQLIEIERDAWDYAAISLAPLYNLIIEDDHIQEALDTYRDWLHARSRCPTCSATGVQTKTSYYRCVACGNHWRVNDARNCMLRRYSLAN
jgi:hypothetical protein